MKVNSILEKLLTRVTALRSYKEKVFLFNRTTLVIKVLSRRIRSADLLFIGRRRAISIKANGKTIIFMEKANSLMKSVNMKVTL